MADQLAAPQDLASLLQQDLDTATAVLVIQAATAVVQALLGGQRLVQILGDTVTVAAPHGSLLQLPQRPVTAVTSVTLNGVPLSAGTASGTYRLAGSGLWRDTGWASCYGPTTATVVYDHGYPAGSQELELARTSVLSLAKGSYVNPSGVFSEKIDDYSVAYERSAASLDVSPFLRAALRRQYGVKAGMVSVF